MKSKMLIFLIGVLFLSACGYELPKTTSTNDNSTNSQTQANQNAKTQSNAANSANKPEQANKNAISTTENGNTGDAKLILSGTSESVTYPCNGREVAVEEMATASKYTLTGECRKIVVGGVSNTINVEKVGEIVVVGISNKVIYGEGINGKKPKITKTGNSASVESKAEADKKAAESK